MNIAILSPVYRDQQAVKLLWKNLDQALIQANIQAHWWLVDDGSLETWDGTDWPENGRGITSATVLPLHRNVGHQRAIALGLSWLAKNQAAPPDFILVLDSDGEDRPSDAVQLLKRALTHGVNSPVIFAERTKRSESFLFKMGYGAYLALHYLLVGTAPRVGNFSVLPGRYLNWLVTDSDLWNHYAACIWKSRLPKELVKTERGKRLGGSSRMNWSSLILHGLSAIACYREIIITRLAFVAVLFSLLGVSFLTLIMVGDSSFLNTDYLPYLLSIAATALLTLIFLSLWCINVLQQRNQGLFVPIRDFDFLVSEPITLLKP
jgi:hypothetical protein